jgi:hypothetical protein
MTKIGVLLLLAVLCIPALAHAEIVCDVRQEILAVILAAKRYSSTTSKAVTLQQLPKADAVRAGIDFENQRTRAYYVCPAQLRREGSPEKQIMDLVLQQAHVSDMFLIQGVAAINQPTVKAGNEASLQLIEVAGRYFGLSK